ncbi:TIR domain-containing protein [Thioflexithrix psekupsensis]|uniref:Uncharacterized protein n=1 Tax=Thioflexithrix psekupsensis TaxID=1570016 RepID=A0A251X7X4_9GAMM|nr:TIR domain-containing protein [Thioflexithrix psekupsensis]OUD13309.1 hypothetical protein TPSD3_11835 [Thioflexithrix psekupsensis]
MMITLAEQNFLRRFFLQQFDKDEIKGFYFALQIEIDHLEASSREKLMADLLHHLQRQSRLPELLTQAMLLRPNAAAVLRPFLERLDNLPINAETETLPPPTLFNAASADETTSESLIFISYSSRDVAWCQRLQTHLERWLSRNRLSAWDDHTEHSHTYQTMQHAMQRSHVAILLISSHFLSSDFILTEHIPPLFSLQSRGQLRLYPMIIKPCTWQLVEWLQGLEVYPAHQQALSMHSDSQIDTLLVQIASEIIQHLP